MSWLYKDSNSFFAAAVRPRCSAIGGRTAWVAVEAGALRVVPVVGRLAAGESIQDSLSWERARLLRFRHGRCAVSSRKDPDVSSTTESGVCGVSALTDNRRFF